MFKKIIIFISFNWKIKLICLAISILIWMLIKIELHDRKIEQIRQPVSSNKNK